MLSTIRTILLPPQAWASERMSADEREDCDILVVGGGPAGTTAAVLLRDNGWRVTLVEKDRYPRFHIGESLLPRNMAILRRLGVMEEVQRLGVLKRGADFTMPAGADYVTFNFSTAKAPDEPTAFQVRRSAFDHMLLRNAADRGVTVREGERVTDVRFDADGAVRASIARPDGTISPVKARFLIDASGRDTFMSAKLGAKTRNPRHNSAAVFGHFKGVPRRPGDENGNISIYWFDDGWFWMIPLGDDIMSVGMVVWPKFLKMRQGSLEAFFRQGMARCRPVADRMAEAEAVAELQATGNFSYTSTRMYGDRYVLVGDAFSFIDPVFSSGVYLAMQGASLAADAVDAALREPHRADVHLARFDRRVRRALKRFSWFIYRFTNPAMQHLFMNPSARFGLRAAVTSVLSGDVFGRTRLWRELLMFKAIYYVLNIAYWRRAAAYRRRLKDRG